MIDYREVSFNEIDVNSVKRKLRNGGYRSEDLRFAFTPTEIAAMWSRIEGEYNYCWDGNDAIDAIVCNYLREELISNLSTDEPDLSDRELRMYFDYWYDLH